MPFRSAFALVLGVLLAASLAAGPVQAAQKITWEELVPAWDGPDNPFDSLSEDLQNDLVDYLWVRDLKRDNALDAEAEAVGRRAKANLDAAGVFIEGMLAEIDRYSKLWEQHGEKLVDGLDGKDIRMPGYLLPLEYDGPMVREFLLVPYVGACIHSPPPPPNQIVYVKLSDPIEAPDLFLPVFITGKVAASRSSRNLNLVDGAADIDVGYSLDATLVEPYHE